MTIALLCKRVNLLQINRVAITLRIVKGKRRPLRQDELADAQRLQAIWGLKKDDLELTQESMALRCGWKTQGAFSQYLLGKIPLNLEALIKISEALQVSPEEISPRLAELCRRPVTANASTGGLAEGADPTTSEGIPILGKTRGSSGGHWEELGYPAAYSEGVLEARSHDPEAYALLVEGDTMAPRIRAGEAILVEPLHRAQPGDEVVVRLKTGEMMVRVIVSRREGWITLDALARDEARIVVREQEIVAMHFLAGAFRAGAIKYAPWVETESYRGPDRRTYPSLGHAPERRQSAITLRDIKI